MPRNTNLDALRALRKEEANRHGRTARELHLAYGLIRGRPMDRIESASSNPHLFPDAKRIVDLAMTYFRPAKEGESPTDYEATKVAFRAKLTADLTAWKKKINLAWLESEPKKRARNAAKRGQPRVHRPRPDTLPARVA